VKPAVRFLDSVSARFLVSYWTVSVIHVNQIKGQIEKLFTGSIDYTFFENFLKVQ
jgi:hypothetical protein